MGILEFNVGELTERIRRAFKIKGRAPLRLDDDCILAAQVFDATRAPYRVAEQKFIQNIPTIGPVGAQTSFANIANNSPQSIILEHWEAWNRGATGFGLLTAWENRGPGTLPFWTAEPTGVALDPAITITASLPLLPGVTLNTGTSAVPIASDTRSPFWVQLYPNTGPGDRYICSDLELVIPPGFGITWAPNAVNLAFGFHARIRSVLVP